LAADLNKQTVFGAPLRAWVDTKLGKSADKRWDWVRRGAPLLLEIGGRDAAGAKVSFLRRDALREGEKVKSHLAERDAFVSQAAGILQEVQDSLRAQAQARLDQNMRDDITSFEQLEAYFGAEDTDDFRGWARVAWSRPTGEALEKIGDRLKALKLTIRNAPMAQPKSHGTCIFTGAPGQEQIIVARSY
jgi:prolyl-tRNA synthetase